MKDPREEAILSWPDTAVPSAPYGGILGQLAEPVVEPWNDPRLTTYGERPVVPLSPANLTGWWSTFLSALRANGWNPSSPALQSAPVGANAGFPAAPAQPVVEPWNDSQLATYAQTPSAPTPPFALRPLYPFLPLAHLNSGKYWPGGSATSDASERPPSSGFFPFPRPAPNWDAVPTPPIDTNTAQMYSQPLGPTALAASAPSLEHLDSARYWGTGSGPSGERERPPTHGFYLSPVPRAADSKSDSSRGASSGPQVFPDPPPYWGVSAPPASASGYSPAEERALADDARRDGWERVRRGVFRKPPPSDRLDVFAPSWEQVVPTATPWSAWPKLPSPTSWGETTSGMECYTSGGNLHCITPGGRQFTVPANGLRDGLRFAPGEPNYHYYNTPDGPVPFDPARLVQGIINSPTPGPRQLVRPATPQGTLNEATPYVGRTPPINPVMSYLTTDQNGTPLAVNVTQPGHDLSPGVVVRYVTTSPSGSTIQNEGAGTGWWQGPSSPDMVREGTANVWRGHSTQIVRPQSQKNKGRPAGR